MHNVSRFFAGTLILAIVCLLGGCGTAAPIVGANAPDFTLMNQDSKSVSLKDYRGQWVVLYFYPADFGTRGTAGTRTFKRDQSQFNELHTAIIGVSGDDVSRHKAFIEKEQLPFTLLADPKGNPVSKRYGNVESTHVVFKMFVYNTYIIDPSGKVARVFHDLASSKDPSTVVLNAVKELQRQS